MSLLRKIAGPKSKYDKKLPYTYRAEVPEIPGNDEIVSNYFADTLCGLIDYLNENGINPDMASIYGIYRKKEVVLDTKHCVSEEGLWLTRPEICRAMEKKYHETLDEIYRGHVADDNCDFDDRDREGMGPN